MCNLFASLDGKIERYKLVLVYIEIVIKTIRVITFTTNFVFVLYKLTRND